VAAGPRAAHGAVSLIGSGQKYDLGLRTRELSNLRIRENGNGSACVHQNVDTNRTGRNSGKEAWKAPVGFDWGWKGGEGGCFGIGSEGLWGDTAAGGGSMGGKP